MVRPTELFALFFSDASLLLHSKKVWGWNLGFSLSVQKWHVLPVHAWIFSGHSSFLPQSKDMLVSWSDQSKLSIGVNTSVKGCSSLKQALLGVISDFLSVLAIQTTYHSFIYCAGRGLAKFCSRQVTKVFIGIVNKTQYFGQVCIKSYPMSGPSLVQLHLLFEN